jgi:hypothetical protein
MPRDLELFVTRSADGKQTYYVRFPGFPRILIGHTYPGWAQMEFEEWTTTPTWTCDNYHFNPDTGAEFENAPSRSTCEICRRPRPG